MIDAFYILSLDPAQSKLQSAAAVTTRTHDIARTEDTLYKRNLLHLLLYIICNDSIVYT